MKAKTAKNTLGNANQNTVLEDFLNWQSAEHTLNHCKNYLVNPNLGGLFGGSF